MQNHPVPLEPLTPTTFSPFGTVTQHPSHSPSTPPSLIPPSVPANQRTATKFLNVLQPVNNYQHAPSQTSSSFVVNMFACATRRLRGVGFDAGDERVPTSLRRAGLRGERAREGRKFAFEVGILERHPFTFQTFVPLGLDAADDETAFLVVVAPTVEREVRDATGKVVHNGPDLSRLRAFLAHGGQGVTYAAGTWHAPMVVVGVRRVDFVVWQWSNGIAEEDCEEFEIGETQRRDVLFELEDGGSMYDDAWEGSKL